MNRSFLCVLAVLLLAGAARAEAASVCPDFDQVDPGSDSIGAFDDLLGQASMGGQGCDSDFCKALTAWEAAEPSAKKVEEAGEFMDTLRASALALPAGSPGVAILQRHLVEWQQLLARADVLTLPTAVWAPANFVLFPNRPDDEIDFEQVLEQQCPDSVGECEALFKTSACVYTHAVLQRRLLLELLEENRKETVDYLQQLNGRWTAFNSGGRGLFPWELAFNNLVNRKQFSQRGFVEPPQHQIAFLHPSVALEYQDAGGGDLEEALVLELGGFYRWRWGGDDGAQMVRPFGVSAIASWTGSGDPGYGLMVHLPKNWSLGVTRRDFNGEDETTYLLSVDLGKLLVDQRKLRQSLIDKIDAL
ncbi:MAG: hypothetical protein AAFN78_03850 [Pseudomonadota bacterium]